MKVKNNIMFKTFKKSHSDFWLRDSDRLYSDTEDDFVKALRLSTHKRAISNFVNILTGENYPVYFKGETSYTDGKMVVIGSDLKNNNHDETVGLALHEASHLKLTDFDLLPKLDKKIPKDLYTKAEKLGYNKSSLQGFVKTIVNIVEDRRIDNYIYKSAPGYREYYKALYNRYFYSEIITKGLMSSEARDETFNSYLFRIVNLINSASSLTALKGLKEIAGVIDIKNISRLENTGDTLKVALKITKIVIDNVEQNSGKDDKDTKKGKGKLDPDAEVRLDPNGSSGDSEGDTIDFDDLSDKQKDSLKKQMEEINKFLDGDDSNKKELTKGEKTSLMDVNNSNASIEQVGEDTQGSGSIKKVDCIVYKAMDKALIDSKSFALSSNYKVSEEAVSKGIRIGKALGKKLQIRNEVRNTQYNRQSRGKVDSRMIAAAGFGYENIFEQTLHEAYKGATIHISIDASGSMSGHKFNQAITNAVAIAKASDVIGNMDVSISFRSTQNSSDKWGGHGLPMIVMAYDSKKDKLSKITELFPYLGANGTTPEGLCFEAIMDMLQESGKDLDSYFINLSDGSPWFENENFVYGNTNGARHTRLQVKKMEAKGIKILSYFVGSSTRENQTFIDSYGRNNSSFVDVENVNDIAKTINKLMLKK